jgi:K+-transporting ATPase KdpF subunit
MIENGIGLFLAIATLAYLGYAMLRPEAFG